MSRRERCAVDARSWRVTCRWLVAGCLPLLGVLAMGGCELFSFGAVMVTGGDKIEPVYTLPDRVTAVVVDDPLQALGGPALSAVVATNLAHHLKQNGAVDAAIVPEREVAGLADRLGSDYATLPIDEIGRRVGAKQVIYVEIEQATLLAAPGAYRPTARVELKVIDAVTGKRLYPPPPAIIEPGAPSRGRSVVVQMRYEGVETHSRGTDAMLTRTLAERIGLDVARLFYEHRPDPKFE